MKKLLVLTTVLLILLSLTACSQIFSNVLTGEVVTCGGEPYFFELAADDGKNYGFLVSEETKLIWEDKSALSLWSEGDNLWDIFSCSMYVTVISGEPAESSDAYVDECVEGWYYAEQVTVTGVKEEYFAVCAKPVIYLYPEITTDVEVKLEYNGRLTCTYPEYAGGWNVTAQPDGTLTDEHGMAYSYLYWEGVNGVDYDFPEGFCVAGSDTAAFLEDALAKLGLTRKEANEFIVYWLPQMEGNAFNLISFQTDAYTENAILRITPKPDTVLRVFMAWKSLEEAVEIRPQDLENTERVGFTVVEWGGTELNH